MTNDVSTLVYDSLPEYSLDYKDATRNISGNLLKLLNKSIPNLVGGSADVAASVKTGLPDEIDYSSEHYEGRNINFGIREFAMAAIQMVFYSMEFKNLCWMFLSFLRLFKTSC